ncbi:flagellum-specific ATP synthase [Bacillus thermophilus]|uniref:Flagellum-specific ATP synthase n=1 Tax=Siminovitchia thermophila TaxID=1245522 RepID=A0ABS2RBB8_9BACI|nr:flagellar protein export ATPase FliI [Siminovitchia thermophila]MBM7716479.1 flagellum-specific ATP synthase [Siminovitchia thermophila]ONK23239.1 flagellar protein export ATPase FliI [Bacillus sp. VT-16-64]
MKAKDLIPHIRNINTFKRYGKVTKVVGLMIESHGPESSIGDVCLIHVSGRTGKIRTVMAEVVGFQGRKLILMPYSNLMEVAPGSLVESTNKPLKIHVGNELIGKVVDPLGVPMDGSLVPQGMPSVPIERNPPPPLTRPSISSKLEVGIRVIDSLLTVGHGQRLGIFAGSGVGKSTLLGMIARNIHADVNVIALIGERGREVKEFIERDLGPEGLKKSIIVAATSDQPALMRIRGAFTATAIAEYFRDKGCNVTLLMDSVTRVAMSQREIGLAVGEPPTTKGYTPSVFALLPRLMERTGTSEKGSITAFYTVLVDGDDLNEPVADTVRGILDGHVVLDRAMAQKGHYPAINVLNSISRLMNHLVTPEHKKAAEKIRNVLGTYMNNEDLINIGAYKKGSSAEIDEAIQYYPAIMKFLQQETNERISSEECIRSLIHLVETGEFK